MKPDRAYLNQLQDEDKIFISRLYDMMESCCEKYNVRYTHFLDSRQQMLALSFLNRESFKNFIFYGGYKPIICPEFGQPSGSEGLIFNTKKIIGVTHAFNPRRKR